METHLNNKFYVPDISEFYVGFEYEVRNDSYNPVTGNYTEEWEKEVYSQNDFLDVCYDGEYEFDNDMGYCRVKYLDKADIEELLKENGWDVVENDYASGGWNSEFCKDCEFFVEAHRQDKPMLFIYKKKGENKPLIIEVDEYQICGPVWIKNKSELKVLLKQLGING